MLDFIFRIIGRISLVLNYLRLVKAPRDTSVSKEMREKMFDKTGLVGRDGPLRVLWDADGVKVIEYESLAHTIWRAQEFSLLGSFKDDMVEPVADFGCGDGSFSGYLYGHVEYGIDNDAEALGRAEARGIYSHLIESTNDFIPMQDGTIGTVVANSVLEHLWNLDALLAEFHRILQVDGRLLITMPIIGFKRHIEEYFGKNESIKINSEYCHYNLFEAEEWVRRLESIGFDVTRTIQYQDKRFTFMYMIVRFAGRRGLGFFFPWLPRVIWRVFGKKIVKLIGSSIHGVDDGANVLIFAIKKEKSYASV